MRVANWRSVRLQCPLMLQTMHALLLTDDEYRSTSEIRRRRPRSR